MKSWLVSDDQLIGHKNHCNAEKEHFLLVSQEITEQEVLTALKDYGTRCCFVAENHKEQRAVYQLLTSFDQQQETRTHVVARVKAMYLYGLAVTLK